MTIAERSGQITGHALEEPMAPSSLRFRAGRLFRAAVVACAIPLLVPAHAETPCPSAPLASLRLPHLRAALAAGREAVIVALGSSSTKGTMASAPGHNYPAVLQSTLASALPDQHVA